MPGGVGPMFGEPAALGLRQRCSAERIFAGQTTAIELAFEVRQGAGLALFAGTLDQAAGHAHDEPEAILKVVDRYGEAG